MDSLDKELKKNEKYRQLIYEQLNKDKQQFANQIRESLGKEIIDNFKENKKEVKISFWKKIKNYFNNV